MTLKEIYGKTNFPFVEANGSFKAIPVSISDRQKLIKSNPISLVKNQYILNELNEQNDFITESKSPVAPVVPVVPPKKPETKEEQTDQAKDQPSGSIEVE